MEQCKNSHSPYYLLGNISLDDPQYICKIIIHRSQVVWIGVVRQIYTSIDQGILILYFIFEIVVQQSKNCMIQRFPQDKITINHDPNILVAILLSNEICIY